MCQARSVTENVPAEPLPLPDVVSWQIFPFEGDMRVRPLQPRLDHERIRNGDPGGDACFRCNPDVAKFDAEEPVWQNDRWAVRPLGFDGKPSPFPAYMLETIEHLDIDDLSEEMAAELGVLSVRMNSAIMAIGTVGRVHINRWGDGAAHFHVWFLGRPAGAWQFSGYTLPLWGFTLPSMSAEELTSNHQIVAASLSEAAAR